MENWQQYLNGDQMQQVLDWLTFYGLRLLGALAILLLGKWLARFLTGMLRRLMITRRVESTLISFSCNMVYATLITFVVIAAINQLGVQTTSFIAVLGAAGLAIGLALQGSLANFAAGVMILLFKPFKVNDFIEAGGVLGIVEDLHIFTTQIRTADNKTIFVPNGKLAGDNIINYSQKPNRRIDLVIGVAYDADLRRTKEVLLDIIRQDQRILGDPAPLVAVLELADSSVNLVVRPWVKTAQYWDVYFDLVEAIKARLDQEGIGIPFPQRDVHLFQKTA
ncbi:MAG: mechanosensitive ion channel [Desulfuromonadaceae bacterium]